MNLFHSVHDLQPVLPMVYKEVALVGGCNSLRTGDPESKSALHEH